jgi:sterol desaturase/sphingolipid hydroxylase (fatty acid hydroxylase superfamily)
MPATTTCAGLVGMLVFATVAGSHDWHHTDTANAREKSFAGLLPVWDILFATYYMPKDRAPVQFGTSTPVPASLVGQMLFPFRRS